jgi:hypothetical protein
LIHCPQIFCSCMFIFDFEAVIHHWYWTESEGLKKDMYGYQQCVKWYPWDNLIISSCIQKEYMHCPFLFWLLHVNNCGGCHHLSLVRNGVKGTEEGQQVWVPAVFQMVYLIYIDHTLYFLYPKKGLWCNAHNYFAVTYSNLWQRPSFVTGDEWSQSDLRRTGMGIKMCQIVKLVNIYCPQCPVLWIRPLLQFPQLFCWFHVHFLGGCRHLSLMMNGVKGTEEGHVWVPAMCVMV